MEKASSFTRDSSYYEWMKVGSRRSAMAVVPLLVEIVAPRSVLDAGCGTGSWLKVFQEHGVDHTLGLDGDWVDRSLLEISADEFRTADLRDDFRVGRRFDLALCLEVAHYFPAETAEQFVGNLSASAPIVLFSAAIPGQDRDGLNHQWPEYWAKCFEDRGYVCVDCVRPKIWDMPEVEVWYAQNVLLFVDRAHLPSQPQLAREYERARDRPLSLVHPRMFLAVAKRLAQARADRAASGRGPSNSTMRPERA